MKHSTAHILSLLCLATAGSGAIHAVAAPAVRHNAYGQPDLDGTWTNTTVTPFARATSLGTRSVYTDAEVKQIETQQAEGLARGNLPTDPQEGAPENNGIVGGYNVGWTDPGTHVMRINGQARSSFLTTPDGQVPLNREGKQVAPRSDRISGAGWWVDSEGHFQSESMLNPRRKPVDNPEDMSLGEQCVVAFGRNLPPPMLPNDIYNNNYRIVQSKDSVAISSEMVHDTRVIRIGKRDHIPQNIRPWFGDSVGWYDGEALVVETTNYPKVQAFYGVWQDLKVTERFQRTTDGRINYKFSVEAPSVWDKPWGGEYDFAPASGRIVEYACHEGNYAFRGIIGGDRLAEQAAQKVSENTTSK